MYFNFLKEHKILSSKPLLSINTTKTVIDSLQQCKHRLQKQFEIYKRDKEIQRYRSIKAQEGCPLMGYCPYDVSEPFDCSNCPQK